MFMLYMEGLGVELVGLLLRSEGKEDPRKRRVVFG